MSENINLKFITVVRNDVDGLIKTINSMNNLAKNSKKFLFTVFIQDGLSEDKTLLAARDLIKKNKIENIKFSISSEIDNGIFDAMNKPLKFLKQNDLVCYMNAGDIISEDLDYDLFNESIQTFFKSESKMCAFRSKNFFSDIYYFMPPKKIKTKKDFSKWITNNTPVHQSIFFKFDERTPLLYSTKFKIQSDTLLIYNYINKYGYPIFFNNTFCDFELGGLSNSYKSFSKVLLQIREQKLISELRGEKEIYIYLRKLSLFLKFFLHNIFGKNFHKIHAISRYLLN
tara:strand:- start:1852 stop:2706 length:855 start_codon:yes stop_codon:yes gene_type:complete